MTKLHIHDVLNDMQDGDKTFSSKKDFIDYIVRVFGEDCRFHSCSKEDMDANMAFDFLIHKNKIMLDEQNQVSLHPSMKMCDSHKNSDHHTH